MKKRRIPHNLSREKEYFDFTDQWDCFPQTRYLGSKRKLLGMLCDVFQRLSFETALDPFSGTGSVSYLLKAMGKAVTANDVLESCAVSARALVENSDTTLGLSVDALVADLPDPNGPPGFVESTFDNIFFEPEENRFIDGILPRLHGLSGPQRDSAFHAVFQACLAKRPYNLFHRANLYMRRQDVARSFGNKTTWDRPFSELIRRFSLQADQAVFDSGQPCRTLHSDIFDIDPTGYDLVYLDPPYVSANGAGVDYLDYYHFMEGMLNPESWSERILHRYKHKPILGRGTSPWIDAGQIGEAFEAVLTLFAKSIIVISYRSDGIPGIHELTDLLAKFGKKVEIVDGGRYTYALSRNRRSKEIIIIGK